MRIVSLACSNTEIVCALGRGGDLVGVDDHSDHPSEIVERLPRVGPDLQIDPAKVAALKPDLVLASLTVPGHEKVIESIEAKGLPCHVFGPTSLPEVFLSIEDIANLIGAMPRAGELLSHMREALPTKKTADPNGPSVIVQWWPKPVIAPGGQSWVQDLLQGAGAINPLGQEDLLSRPLTDEEVRDLNPDAIVLSWCGVPFEKYRPEVVYDNPLWQDIAAVRNRRVVAIPEALLGRPGPRLVEGYRALCGVVEVGAEF